MSAQLLELAHAVGRPELAILGEGNVSQRIAEGRMLVKATGSNLGRCTEEDLVEVDTVGILALLDDPDAGDDEVSDALMQSRIRDDAKRPSVEALLHAVVLDAGAGAACHTHPISVNGILCSDRAELLVRGSLFPDQIVVLGQHSVLIPYIDPGLELARAVRARLADFVAAHGQLPKVVYLKNHGIFAIGSDTAECLRITEMADKFARILAGALAIGAPVFLSETDADRIENRADEHYRRRILKERRS